MERACRECGNSFSAIVALIRLAAKKGQTKEVFCSPACHARHRRKPECRVARSCARCGKDFEVFRSAVKRKYCSPECARIKATPVNKTCLVCGTAYTVIPSHDAESKTCSRKCGGVRTTLRQKKNGKEERQRLCSKKWKRIRRDVLVRDGARCTACGVRDGGLHVHHVIPWQDSRDDSLGNLTTLCNSCHMKAEVRINPRHKYYASRETAA